MKMPRDITACALWVAALACMSFGSIDTAREGHNSVYLAWGLFIALAACVPTGACIVRKEFDKREEASVDHIVEVVDALHQGRRDLHRLH